MTRPFAGQQIFRASSAILVGAIIGKKVLTMADFYFAVGSDPCDVFIVVNGNWIPYKRCDTEEAAQALVTGQNESRRDGNA